MAYDFGRNALGIKNPFRTEGVIRSFGSFFVIGMGVISILQVSPKINENPRMAWSMAISGFILLSYGINHLGHALFQLFRFYVGRSVPSSLAHNFAESEAENAALEKACYYNAKTLESMLVGRKNTTFVEPIGWLQRLIHSLFPRLIFLPRPLRKFAQQLCMLMISTVVALLCFGIAFFVCYSGLAGENGMLIIPIISIFLLCYLLYVWSRAGKAVVVANDKKLKKDASLRIAPIIGFSILIPILVSVGATHMDHRALEELKTILSAEGVFDAWNNLGLLLGLAGAVIFASVLMFMFRLKEAMPNTEVSEYRENLQESIHPHEIFINVDNIILANRRYKEIPNRIYTQLKPSLHEQSRGKGNFRGQLLAETQPEFTPTKHSKKFLLVRFLSTVAAEAFQVIAASLFFLFCYRSCGLIDQWITTVKASFNDDQLRTFLMDILCSASSLMVVLFAFLAFASAARILSTCTHLFWSEMRFKSMLLWIKMEGTFTESKISTGMSIYDSTRSENVLVRSSITPWIILSNIETFTFATSGINNLELPRYVMSMNKSPSELDAIVSELKSFLRNRESIASITNEADIRSAQAFMQVNKVNRDSLPAENSDVAGRLHQASTDSDMETDVNLN